MRSKSWDRMPRWAGIGNNEVDAEKNKTGDETVNEVKDGLDQNPGTTATVDKMEAGMEGVYESAEPELVPLVALKYVPPFSLNMVPPTAVTKGELAGKSTANPSAAEATPLSQSAAPESPAGPNTVCPCTVAWRKSWLKTARLAVPKPASQLP